MASCSANQADIQIMKTTERSVVTIDTEGDVFLDLKELEIQVSSKVLATSSQVFKAMFKTNFQEGLNLTQNETCHISLPDDDSIAMHVLCVLMHHREPRAAKMVNSQLLHKVAILAEKYACITVARYWTALSINILSNALDIDERSLTNLLATAYVLNLADQFTAITKRMVYFVSSDPSRLLGRRAWPVSQGARGVLPEGLIGTIIHHEEKMSRGLLDTVEGIMDHLVECHTFDSDETHIRDFLAWGPHSDTLDLGPKDNLRRELKGLEDCEECKLWKVFQVLDNNGIWPTGQAYRHGTLGSLIEKLTNLKRDSWTSLCIDCELRLAKILKEFATLARSSFGGLCLDCVKYRRNADEPYPCRYEHSAFGSYLGFYETSYVVA